MKSLVGQVGLVGQVTIWVTCLGYCLSQWIWLVRWLVGWSGWMTISVNGFDWLGDWLGGLIEWSLGLVWMSVHWANANWLQGWLNEWPLGQCKLTAGVTWTSDNLNQCKQGDLNECLVLGEQVTIRCNVNWLQGWPEWVTIGLMHLVELQGWPEWVTIW